MNGEKDDLTMENLCQNLVDEGAYQAQIEIMQEEIDALRQEKDSYYQMAAEYKADLINFKNRTEKDIKRIRSLAAESSVMLMLPVLDNLERALDSGCNSDVGSVLSGVSMVRDSFVRALEQLGVSVINPVGEVFNVQAHEAVGKTGVVEPEQDGVVQMVYQKGYQLHDTVIRPAKVVVGEFSPIGD